MKKILCLIVACLLFGCGTKDNKDGFEPIPEKLLTQIQETMPETVYNELKERGKCDESVAGTIRVVSGENAADFDYALCLDFSYEDNRLVQFVYKPYSDGTFDNGTLLEEQVTQEEAIQVAKNFAKVFFGEERKFHKSVDLSGYDTGDYITLQDEFGNSYLIQLNGGLLLQYHEKD